MSIIPIPVYMHSLPATGILKETGKLEWRGRPIHIHDALPRDGVWDGPPNSAAKTTARRVLMTVAQSILGVDFGHNYSEEEIEAFNAKLKPVADAMDHVSQFILMTSGLPSGGVSYGIGFTHLPRQPQRIDEAA
jgi:hypothetical protein